MISRREGRDLASETRLYPSIGKCIYCGETRYNATKSQLGREHIVPYALGGRHIFAAASCSACEDAMKTFEQPIARKLFIQARTIGGLPTNNKKERPTSFPLIVGSGDDAIAEEIRMEDYPGLVVSFHFPPPDALLGLEPSRRVFTGGIAMATLPGFADKAAKFLPRGFSTPRLGGKTEQLGRLLAKIAHGFALGELGERYRPYLLGIIQGRDLDLLHHYVGGHLSIPEPLSDLYDLSLSSFQRHDGVILASVSIRLLAHLGGMPAYRVIAGEIIV